MKNIELVNNQDGTLTIKLPEVLNKMDFTKSTDLDELENVLLHVLKYVQIRQNELKTGQ